MRRLFRSDGGYVLIFAILVLPIFMWFGLLIVDLGRGNNAQGDLQATVDALALSGARELDGGVTAIDDARAAMANLQNSVSMLGVGDEAQFSLVFQGGGSESNGNERYRYEDGNGNQFEAVFLTDIPALDTTPIDEAWLEANKTSDGRDAEYVYVAAWSRNLQAAFLNFSVPISVSAVATNPGPTACRVTPIYICNPFEGTNNEDFEARFAAGDMYGRLVELRFDSSQPPGPGNFGFLRTGGGSGANVLRDALATGDSQTCFEQSEITTEPGENVGPVIQGINTHFGIYTGSLGSESNNIDLRPALNVRMGQSDGNNSPSQTDFCGSYDPVDPEDDGYIALGFPRGSVMAPISTGGGLISADSSWDIDLYWHVNHGNAGTIPQVGDEAEADAVDPLILTDIRTNYSSHPSGTTPSTVTPSRYDVFRYEIASSDPTVLPDLEVNENLLESAAPNGETGVSQCTDLDLTAYTGPGYRERRTIFSAVVNCGDYDLQGQATVPSVAFSRVFLTNPGVTSGNTRTLSIEFIDATGAGGLGSLSELVREEAWLVR